VYLTTSGAVTVRNSQVISRVDPGLAKAQLTLLADLRNASNQPVTGLLTGAVGALSVSRPVTLAAGESRRVSFSPSDYPQLVIANPALWWPYELGPQNLQNLHVEFQIGGAASDTQDVEFGIREYTSELDSHQHRLFRVNGKPIMIRGGGWTQDMLLRVDDQREESQLQYLRDMNLNAIRLEGQMMSDHFFTTADRLGLMVMPGWSCCSYWEEWDQWTDDDYFVATESLRNEVRRLRNHASVFVFLYGSFFAPPPRAEQAYLKVFTDESWPHPYLSAATDRTTPGAGPTGIKPPGPYEYVPPNYWSLDKDRGGAWGFVTEATPGAAVPVRSTIEQMLPAESRWPINDVWNYHTGGGRFSDVSVVTAALEGRYGPALDLNDYLRKSQAMSYEGERAMFEAFRRNKYTSATGVIHWLANNGWPSLIWHLFDYYSRPGGGYFGTKKGNEPLHVQYSYDDASIVVVNTMRQAFSGYSVTAHVYNFDLSDRFTKTASVDIPADGMAKAFVIPALDGLSRTYFIRLTLKDPSGALVSSNFYWLSTRPDAVNRAGRDDRRTPFSVYADLTDLQKLPAVNLSVSVLTGQDSDNETDLVTVTNPSSNLAFGVHLTVRNSATGDDLAPVFWDDNYFELFPGESRKISATFAKALLGGATSTIQVDGWNVTAN
jgi:exo-1,4-beta-D-glucosaminidase